MQEVKEIILGFENCESMSLPYNFIGDFTVEGIHEEVCRVAINSICKLKIADTVVIELFKEADGKYYPLGFTEDATSKFERIKQCRDITSITVTYDDDSEDELLIRYDADCIENFRQSVYESEFGNLYITISDKPFEELFNMETINDKDYVDFAKRTMLIWNNFDEESNPYSEKSLPDMYRYVYLFDEDGNNCLAMRVYDQDCDWKLIYEPESVKRLHCPVRWMYPGKTVEEKMRSGEIIDESFSIGAILNKYPKEGFV